MIAIDQQVADGEVRAAHVQTVVDVVEPVHVVGDVIDRHVTGSHFEQVGVFVIVEILRVLKLKMRY